MNRRHQFPAPSTRLARTIIVAACAAVLLTAFEDEALLGLANARASAASQSAPQPDQTEELTLFPDLSPARSERGEHGVDACKLSSASSDTGPVTLEVVWRPEAASGDQVADAGRWPLRARICVWQI